MATVSTSLNKFTNLPTAKSSCVASASAVCIGFNVLCCVDDAGPECVLHSALLPLHQFHHHSNLRLGTCGNRCSLRESLLL